MYARKHTARTLTHTHTYTHVHTHKVASLLRRLGVGRSEAFVGLLKKCRDQFDKLDTGNFPYPKPNPNRHQARHRYESCPDPHPKF